MSAPSDHALLAVDVEGRLREMPLAPTVLYAEGASARALARALLARWDEPVEASAPDAAPAPLLGVASSEAGYLVLSGAREALPWIEGARYFGIDPAAPRLRLSSTHGPSLADGTSLSASLLERAITARAASAGQAGPWLVLRGRLVSLANARPIERGLLAAFEASCAEKEPTP